MPSNIPSTLDGVALSNLNELLLLINWMKWDYIVVIKSLVLVCENTRL